MRPERSQLNFSNLGSARTLVATTKRRTSSHLLLIPIQRICVVVAVVLLFISPAPTLRTVFKEKETMTGAFRAIIRKRPPIQFSTASAVNYRMSTAPIHEQQIVVLPPKKASRAPLTVSKEVYGKWLVKI